MCPIIDVVAKELNLTVNFLDFHSDHGRVAVDRYQVRAVPTIIVLNDGVEVRSHTGMMSKPKLKEFLEE
jgi:thioredoxin-like negative regulator of GroEL